MGPAVFRLYYDCPTQSGRQELFTTALVLLLLVSAVILVPAIMLSGELSRLVLDMDGGGAYLVLAFSAMLVGPLVTVPQAFFRAEKKARQYTLVAIGWLAANVVLSLLLAVAMKLGVMGVFLANLISSVLATVLVLPSLVRNLRPSISATVAKRLLAFGVPIGLGLLPMYLIDMADRYFLNSFSTLQEVGLYSVGYKFPWIIKGMIVQSFVLAWGPFVVSMKDKDDATDTFAMVTTYFVLLLMGATLVFSILSPEVLRIFSAPEFWSAYQVVPILCLSYSIYGMYYIFNAGIYVTKKTRYVPAVIVLAMLVNLRANFVLVPQYGMMGAAVATLLAHTTMAAGMFAVSLRIFPLKFEVARLAKLVMAAGLVYGASILVKRDMDTSLSLGLKSLLLMCFPLLLVLLRFFEPRETARARLLLAEHTPDFIRAFL
jgi:O-antigen/teichoic acid export membrane protein